MLPPQLLDELDELTHRLGADLIMGPRAHHAYGSWVTVHLDDESMETLGQKVYVTSLEDDRVRVEAGFAIRTEVAALAGSGRRRLSNDIGAIFPRRNSDETRSTLATWPSTNCGR